MIVNVNPFDTGFDENSHVMKFSAVAKGIMTVKNNVPAFVEPVVLMTPEKKEPRVVRLSLIDGGEEEEVLYQEDDVESEFDEDEDNFVDALLDELSLMRRAVRRLFFSPSAPPPETGILTFLVTLASFLNPKCAPS